MRNLIIFLVFIWVDCIKQLNNTYIKDKLGPKYSYILISCNSLPFQFQRPGSIPANKDHPAGDWPVLPGPGWLPGLLRRSGRDRQDWHGHRGGQVHLAGGRLHATCLRRAEGYYEGVLRIKWWVDFWRFVFFFLQCAKRHLQSVSDPEKVARVKKLYEELGLPTTYAIYEEESYNIIKTHIQQISRGLPHELFFKIMEKIYRRDC